jgi:hypothetical protein
LDQSRTRQACLLIYRLSRQTPRSPIGEWGWGAPKLVGTFWGPPVPKASQRCTGQCGLHLHSCSALGRFVSHCKSLKHRGALPFRRKVADSSPARLTFEIKALTGGFRHEKPTCTPPINRLFEITALLGGVSLACRTAPRSSLLLRGQALCGHGLTMVAILKCRSTDCAVSLKNSRQWLTRLPTTLLALCLATNGGGAVGFGTLALFTLFNTDEACCCEGGFCPAGSERHNFCLSGSHGDGEEAPNCGTMKSRWFTSVVQSVRAVVPPVIELAPQFFSEEASSRWTPQLPFLTIMPDVPPPRA